MKKGLRFALAGSLLTATIITLSTSEPKYTPVSSEEQSAAGAAAYLHGLRANQITGTVNQEDIQSAIESLADMPRSGIRLAASSKTLKANRIMKDLHVLASIVARCVP